MAEHESHPLSRAVESPLPGFGLVMATGIVSLASHFLDLELVAISLFWVNAGAYIALWILTCARLARHPRRVRSDLADHARGPGFFSLVAGTSVLGMQCAIVLDLGRVAAGLWVAGLVLWIVVTYAFFTAVTVKEEKPTLALGLNGSWLLAVVATQSLAALGSAVAHQFGSPQSALLLAATMHMAGAMLYLPLIALMLYRWTFVQLTPQQLTPPYWINMGALAVSALAGARLLQQAGGHPLLVRLTPFLEGTTFLFWSVATWWIPLLVVLGFWRHVARRMPLAYDPQYWAMAFPLGMYTVSTMQVARALDIPEVVVIARGFIWFALAAWVVTFVGMCKSIARGWGWIRSPASS